MPIEYLVFADDLSGGNAVGAEFARHGFSTVVLSGENQTPDAVSSSVVVIDTATRACRLAEASGRVSDLAGPFAIRAPRILVKKTDSLLRGMTGGEIDALAEVFREPRCLFVAAAPQVGRTTLNGIQYIQGIPLAVAIKDLDPLARIFESHVPTLIAAQSRHPVGTLPLAVVRAGQEAIGAELVKLDRGIIVADCETEEDMAVILAAGLRGGMRFFAGSYGIGEGLMQAGYRLGDGKPVLIVVGSQSEVSAMQAAELAEDSGCRTICLDLGAHPFDATANELARDARVALAEALKARRDVVLVTTPSREATRRFTELSVLRGKSRQALADRVEAVLAAILRDSLSDFDGFAATGGDTARTILGMAGGVGLRLEGWEVLPGTPMSRIVGGSMEGRPFLTKAGAFGDSRALSTMLASLRRVARTRSWDVSVARNT
jgi:D-threonate/D-erythronate kinase